MLEMGPQYTRTKKKNNQVFKLMVTNNITSTDISETPESEFNNVDPRGK